MAVKKGGLGRGLDSLFNENAAQTNDTVCLKLTEIEPNREQPRRSFDEAALTELADSISAHGLLQPIIVRPMPSGSYQIVAGERRWRACRQAGLSEVPVIIKEIDDKEYYELALIENLQREDLNAIEEAIGYKTLMGQYGLTQEQISQTVGKSRSAVANALRLLNLNDAEQEALSKGIISAGHARALLGCENEAIRTKMLLAAADGASVRELERMAKQKPSVARKGAEKKPSFYSEVELALKDELHRKVNITPTKNGRGTLTIEFYSNEELSEFARKLAD